jgi:uncharacterized membrane protein YhfC
VVSNETLVAIVIQFTLSIILPVVLLIIYKRKWQIPWKAVMIGSFTFLLFSMVLKNLLQNYFLSMNQTTSQLLLGTPILLVLFAALAAGIFEEVGRYISYRFLLKDHRERKDGIAFGIGHGGIEAVLVGALGAFATLQIAIMINQGSLDNLIAAQPALAQQKEVIINTPSYHFILAGLERAAALGIQVALSILVLYGIRQRKIAILILAILLHTGVDILAGLYQIDVLPLVVTEIIIYLLGILALYFVLRSQSLFNKSEAKR